MRIAVVAVGRLKAGPERDLATRYRERISAGGRALGIAALDLIEIDESRAKRAEDRRTDEAKLIAARLPDGAAIVHLDERGRDMTSEAFADFVAGSRGMGKSLAFVIGGPDGLDPALAGAMSLRFGAMTLPHGLVRVLLLEQVYRATTILAGHPYHRGAP